jgi:nitrogen fixation/metabolism regulation signal transduction histidine kinase
MGFNRFVFNIILRSLGIAVNALAISFISLNYQWFFTFAFFCIIFVFQIFLLIRYVTKINRDLAQFLVHIKEQDTTLAFSKHTIDKVFSGLSKEFNKINNEIKKINADKIKKQNLLNQLINQVGTSIIILDNENNIKLHNNAVLNLLGASESELTNKLFSTFKNLKSIAVGDQIIETIQINNLTRRILISRTEIREEKEASHVYTFHDIDREMTDYELQSWNGLIKVLSHEILNTITPISTVVDTMKDCLAIDERTKDIEELVKKDIDDANKGIKLIKNRINGLNDFTSKFRQFSEVSTPNLSQTNIHDLLSDIVELYKSSHSEIEFELEIKSENLVLNIDKQLIELSINNIIKNAIEACLGKEQAVISIKAIKSNNKVLIEISDNGIGIEPNISRKVFLPFYTTKENGSGIGLSLARQIMFSHGGNIEFSSNTNGTTVQLSFNDSL